MSPKQNLRWINSRRESSASFLANTDETPPGTSVSQTYNPDVRTVRLVQVACAALAGFAMASGEVWPQAAQPQRVERPAFKVGDSWTYNKIDGWKNEFEFAVVSTLTEIGGESIVLETMGLDGSGRTRITRTSDFNLVQTEEQKRTRRTSPYYPNYAFPLAVGKTWTRDVEFTDTGESDKLVRARLTARVARWEIVTVPAGTFLALRIDIRGDYHGSNASGSWSGEIRDRLWFSPEVRNAVKYEYEDTLGGGRYTSERFELQRYWLSP
jgi:hypothetical protein